MTYSNGDIYVGEFKNGKEHGAGILTFENGNVFKGTFENGKMVKGILSDDFGNKFVAE